MMLYDIVSHQSKRGDFMKFVDPIREKSDIKKMKDLMLDEGNVKLALLFIVGVNTGLRISDLLELTHEQFQEITVNITEKKTGKIRKITWEAVSKEITRLYKMLDQATGYVFKSNSNNVKNLNRAWTKDYVGRALKSYAKKAGVKGNVSTHTMRKTFGYHFYFYSGKDIVMVQKHLNHASQTITLRYIGIEQETMDKAVNGLSLG